ncbi:MAG: B12-binding domain-containing radical SAM protein, partial [Planctomycetota bacterium]
GFVERSRTVASLPSLGLLTLAGMTPREHHVEYVEVEDVRNCEALPNGFDLVAISSFSAQINEGYELARRYAAAGVPVVMGGLHVTSVPDEPAVSGASAALGEGEVTWPEILDDAAAGRLRPVYDGRDRQFDLADAPLPAYELLDIDRYNRLTVQTSRGCPWRCSFCAASPMLTNRYKQKPLDKVLREIDTIRELWPRPFIEFADDNLFVNRAYWHELLPQLAERRLKWFAETDLSVSEDGELLDKARRAGCVEVLVGFESPVEQGLDGIELRRNWKLRNWPTYKRAIHRIQSHGIRVNACFALGLDGHGPDVFDALFDFVAEAAPFDVQITYLTPFPGTPLHQRLRGEGRLTHDGQWERCTLFDVNYEPQPMTAEQLRLGFHDLASRLYCDEFTTWRKDNFAQRYLRGLPGLRAPRRPRCTEEPKPRSGISP